MKQLSIKREVLLVATVLAFVIMGTSTLVSCIEPSASMNNIYEECLVASTVGTILYAANKWKLRWFCAK